MSRKAWKKEGNAEKLDHGGRSRGAGGKARRSENTKNNYINLEECSNTDILL